MTEYRNPPMYAARMEPMPHTRRRRTRIPGLRESLCARSRSPTTHTIHTRPIRVRMDIRLRRRRRCHGTTDCFVSAQSNAPPTCRALRACVEIRFLTLSFLCRECSHDADSSDATAPRYGARIQQRSVARDDDHAHHAGQLARDGANQAAQHQDRIADRKPLPLGRSRRARHPEPGARCSSSTRTATISIS